jgi:hypothetical protein
VRQRTLRSSVLDLGELLSADVARVRSSLHPDIFRDGETVNTLQEIVNTFSDEGAASNSGSVQFRMVRKNCPLDKTGQI